MIPWYLKIPVKILLAHTPVPRGLWNRLGIFRHGCMTRPEYVLNLVKGHLMRSGVEPRGKILLELGPGDSVGSGIVSYALGAESSVLVDAGAWATRDLDFYRRLVEWLTVSIPDPDRISQVGVRWQSFDEMLKAFSITYLTNGLESLQGLGRASCDFCFSEAVLEHVRVADFPATIKALRNALKPGGTTSHLVDYKDHLQWGLHNMRFSKRLWESPLFAESGFYTNRLRHNDVVRAFTMQGFEILVEQIERWSEVPISRGSLHPGFRHYSDDVLNIKEAVMVFRLPRLVG